MKRFINWWRDNEVGKNLWYIFVMALVVMFIAIAIFSKWSLCDGNVACFFSNVVVVKGSK